MDRRVQTWISIAVVERCVVHVNSFSGWIELTLWMRSSSGLSKVGKSGHYFSNGWITTGYTTHTYRVKFKRFVVC